MEKIFPPPLTDSFQRRVQYLRISVTDRCNLHCRYCAPSRPKQIGRALLLSLEEIERLAGIGVGLGICKIRLTGGEPLMRSGLPGLIARLKTLKGLKDISLTTNGTLIGQLGSRLRQAGLNRINISLDTLNAEKFHRMTGADQFATVWQGILEAARLGFAPVKINTVVMKGFNDDEIENIAALSMQYPFHMRFIEYMPIGTDPHMASNSFVPVARMRSRLQRMGRLIPLAAQSTDGPAERFRFDGARGEIGLIGSMSAHFCRTCNRMRLTADGYLRPCLLADDQVNVIAPMRRGASDHDLGDLFRQALSLKNSRHRLSFGGGCTLQTQMVNIGG
jgi:cyclic pyranopterin phosphate synthase